jgi:SAM-dependent methyltransferase
MGWETYGVEVDPEASERARLKGLSVFTGELFEANFPNNFFDVVRMSYVLEHLPNPKQTLIEIKRILRPHGRIYISVQNARSLNYRLFREKWFSLDVPRHLFSFTPKTIGMLLSTLDLKIKTIRYSSGTRTFLVSLQYWLNDRFQRGKEDRRNPTILRNQFLKPLSRPFCWIVDRLRLGDLMDLEVIKA